MGHGGGVLEQAFHAAEGFGEAEQFRRLAERLGLLGGLEQYGDHAAEAGHLLFRHLVARVCFESRVTHAGNLRLGVEVFGHGFGVVAVAVHAHGEGFEAAAGEVGVERGWVGADPAEEEAELFLEAVDAVVAAADDAADDVGVAADVFRR